MCMLLAPEGMLLTMSTLLEFTFLLFSAFLKKKKKQPHLTSFKGMDLLMEKSINAI